MTDQDSSPKEISPYDNPIGHLLQKGSSDVPALAGLLMRYGIEDINEQLALPKSYPKSGAFKPLPDQEPSSWSYLESYLLSQKDDAHDKASEFSFPLTQTNIQTWSPSVIPTLLVQMGANLDATGTYQVKYPKDEVVSWDILDLAFHNGYYGFCHAMLSDGGPLEHLRPTVAGRTKSGNSWLHVACQEQDSDFVKVLLQWGCDPNAKNDDGETPLFLASTPDEVELLASHGASPTIKNDEGKTCEQRWERSISLASQRVKMSRMLLKKSSNELDDEQWNALRSQWFLNLPFSTKTVSVPLVGKLNIDDKFSYQVNDVSISPLTWMAHHALFNSSEVSKKAGLWNWACTTFSSRIPFSDRASNQQVLAALLLATQLSRGYYYSSEGFASIQQSCKPVLNAIADEVSKNESDPQEVGVELARQLCHGALESLRIPLTFKSSYYKDNNHAAIKSTAVLMHRMLTEDMVEVKKLSTEMEKMIELWPEAAGSCQVAFKRLHALDPDLQLEMSTAICQPIDGYVFEGVNNLDVSRTALGCLPLLKRCQDNPTPEETRALLSLLMGSVLETVNTKYRSVVSAPLLAHYFPKAENTSSQSFFDQFKCELTKAIDQALNNPQWVHSVDEKTWSFWDERAQHLSANLSANLSPSADLKDASIRDVLSQFCAFVMQQQYARHISVETDQAAPKAKRKM